MISKNPKINQSNLKDTLWYIKIIFHPLLSTLHCTALIIVLKPLFKYIDYKINYISHVFKLSNNDRLVAITLSTKKCGN